MPIEDRNGILYLRFQAEGAKVHMSTGLKATQRNRKKAEVIEINEREALTLERKFNIRRMENKTVAEAAPDFLKWLEAEHAETPGTIKAYTSGFNHCRLFFKDRVVSSIDSGDVEMFKVERSKLAKPATVVISLIVFSKFFAYCKKRHWCSENPADDVSRPSLSGSGRIRIINDDEEKQYLEAVADDQDLWDLAVIILNHGPRPNEVMHVRKEDVRLDLGQFAIQKGKTPSARRTVNLTPETLPIFERRINSASKWLFPRPKNPDQHIPLHTLQGRHRKLCDRTGIDFILYDLRHTFATRLLESGASVVVVAKLLGHVNLATVNKYLHPADAMMVDAMRVYSASRQLKLAS